MSATATTSAGIDTQVRPLERKEMEDAISWVRKCEMDGKGFMRSGHGGSSGEGKWRSVVSLMQTFQTHIGLAGSTMLTN